MSVALYLSDAVQQSLLEGPDLQAHCHATEGVSHFVMLVWVARQERQVRRLHLELQAEVDKATTCLLLERGVTGGTGANSLLQRLFSDVVLAQHLEPHERARYVHAHKLASEYSRVLVQRLDQGVDHLLAELRSFYRLSFAGKRQRILTAA